MRGEIDEPPVEHRRHLIDGVAEQKGAVEHRDLGLVLGHVAAVHIDDAGHEVGRPRDVRDLPSARLRPNASFENG